MSAVNRTRASEALPPMGYTEDTAPEIRSYLARVRPRRGCADLDAADEYQRGRSLIERLAISTQGKDSPTLRLTPAQCADVVHFIRNTEPVEEATWFTEPDNEPSHLVGLCVVLEAIESSLRGKGGAR